MKILLVMPAADHLRVTERSSHVPKREMLRFSMLSLTTVAALTPPEHEVTLCDENVEPLDLSDDVDVVGVSFMTGLAPRAWEIAAAFRRRGKITVAGGFFPSLCPEETARHFDAVVVGEAESLWPKVLADIDAGRLRKVYRLSSPCDPAKIPLPRRELTDATRRHYATVHAVQTGRGCTHGCRYCSISAFFGRTHRSRPLADVLGEVRGLPRSFMFVDDNIIADCDYARQLFRAMAPMGKCWISQCSLEIADDPALLASARRAGCRGLFVGIETLSQANLEALDKGFNDSRGYLRRIRAIHRAGIGVQAAIIVGLDGDDVGVFRRTLRFLQRARVQALQLAILTPLPGTRLYEQFDGAGRIADRDWGHYDFRHTVILPKRMTPEELQQGADWLYRQFYRLDRILVRSLWTLATVGPTASWLSWRLNRTYRYDNLREGVVGRDPAARRPRGRLTGRLRQFRRRMRFRRMSRRLGRGSQAGA